MLSCLEKYFIILRKNKHKKVLHDFKNWPYRRMTCMSEISYTVHSSFSSSPRYSSSLSWVVVIHLIRFYLMYGNWQNSTRESDKEIPYPVHFYFVCECFAFLIDQHVLQGNCKLLKLGEVTFRYFTYSLSMISSPREKQLQFHQFSFTRVL